MKKLLLILVAGSCFAQPAPLPSTTYTRGFLKSTDAGNARTNLGILSTNGVVTGLMPDETTLHNNGDGSESVIGGGLSGIPAASALSGTLATANLPAALQSLRTNNASAVSNLNASKLSSGTIPDARFPSVLPAVSGALLTGINPVNSGSNVNVGKTLYVDQVNGSDATGQRGKAGLPFATPGYWLSLFDPDTAAGIPVTGALYSAQSGDLVVLGPGDWTTKYVALPPGVSMKGAGMDKTTVRMSSLISTWGIGFLPCDNAVISDMTITLTSTNDYGIVVGNTLGSSYEVDGTNFNPYTTAAFTNVTFKNCRFRGYSDVFFLNHPGRHEIKLDTCETVSDWDVVLWTGNAASELDATSCRFTSDRTINGTLDTSNPSVLNINIQNGTNRFIACTIRSKGTNRTETAHTSASATAWADFIACDVLAESTISGTSTNYSQQTGHINVVGGTARAGTLASGSVNLVAVNNGTNTQTTATLQTDYSTNSNPVRPDFTFAYQLFGTNATFQFLAPAGVDTTKTLAQTAVTLVTNSAASVINMIAPANVHTNGTWNVTNAGVTSVTWFQYGQKFTNAIALPLW